MRAKLLLLAALSCGPAPKTLVLYRDAITACPAPTVAADSGVCWYPP